MLALYNENRSEFDSLAQQAFADPGCISLPAYRKRLKALGITDARLSTEPHQQLRLETYREGMVTHGLVRGFAYSRHELAPLVESLEAVRPPGEGYRRIGENWYLFVSRD